MIAPPVPRVKSRFSSAFIKERNQVATKKAGFFQLTNEQRKRRPMTDVMLTPVQDARKQRNESNGNVGLCPLVRKDHCLGS